MRRWIPAFCFVFVLKLELERSEWGSDMPSVKTHLDNHKSVHRVIEEFQMSLKEAKLSEVSLLSHFLQLQKYSCAALVSAENKQTHFYVLRFRWQYP